MQKGLQTQVKHHKKGRKKDNYNKKKKQTRTHLMVAMSFVCVNITGNGNCFMAVKHGGCLCAWERREGREREKERACQVQFMSCLSTVTVSKQAHFFMCLCTHERVCVCLNFKLIKATGFCCCFFLQLLTVTWFSSSLP